jgi:hypothetical protein
MADETELSRIRKQMADIFLAGHIDKHDAEKQRQDEARLSHTELHSADRRALDTALTAEQRRLEEHRTAHDAAHAAHNALHDEAIRAHADQHIAEQRAVEAATQAMDKRLDTMNEFRDQLRDQASTFVRREQLESVESAIEKQVNELRTQIQMEREERRASEGTKRGISQSTGVIVGAISLVGVALGIVVVIINLLTGSP